MITHQEIQPDRYTVSIESHKLKSEKIEKEDLYMDSIFSLAVHALVYLNHKDCTLSSEA